MVFSRGIAIYFMCFIFLLLLLLRSLSQYSVKRFHIVGALHKKTWDCIVFKEIPAKISINTFWGSLWWAANLGTFIPNIPILSDTERGVVESLKVVLPQTCIWTIWKFGHLAIPNCSENEMSNLILSSRWSPRTVRTCLCNIVITRNNKTL